VLGPASAGATARLASKGTFPRALHGAFSTRPLGAGTSRSPSLCRANKTAGPRVGCRVVGQDQGPIAWDDHGYYEISLDAKSLTWTPD